MFSFISNIFTFAPAKNLINRLVNRYTGAGITLAIAELVKLGVLPAGIASKIAGLPSAQLATWLSIAVALWLIWHIPYKKVFKTRLEKLKDQVEMLNLKKQILLKTKDIEVLKCKTNM